MGGLASDPLQDHFRFTIIKILSYKYLNDPPLLRSVTKKTYPAHCDFHHNSTSEVLFVSCKKKIDSTFKVSCQTFKFLKKKAGMQ